ncbi:MAG: glycosyltransferase family 4 protein [Microthrixaceae bacterium]
MRVAFVAPLPPPRTGQSIADEAVLDHLRSTADGATAAHDVVVIDSSKGVLDEARGGSPGALVATLSHVARSARNAVAVRRARADVVYHSPSQTRLGNVKDLLLLAALGRSRRTVVLHLHGGGFADALSSNRPARLANRILMGGVGAAIVLGPSLRGQLDGVVSPERIVEIPNFAADELFVDPGGLRDRRWVPTTDDPLRVLFLGSLFESKGWPAVVDAAGIMASRGEERVRFEIAGAAPDRRRLERLLGAVEELPDLHYLGELVGSERRNALWRADVVAVPTSYRWEGQPLVILEAYAAGCAVLATDHAGIGDVFTPGRNGWGLAGADGSAIVGALDEILLAPEAATTFAAGNRRAAESYRREAFADRVEEVLCSVAGGRTPSTTA